MKIAQKDNRKFSLISNKIMALFFVILFFSSPLKAENKKEINILTWWGYLDNQDVINYIDKKCDVDVSFDEYYSNDEFLKRWNKYNYNYDIIIFSDTIYKSVNNIPTLNSFLATEVNSYNPTIRQRYLLNHFPSNVVYFMHSLTGFIWNPSNITLSSNDDIYTMFKKAKNNAVIMIDDPVEESKLFYLAKKNQSSSSQDILNINDFNKIVGNSNVYITNDGEAIMNKNNFAFSFFWSGDAILEIKKINKNYQFLIHPELSYISSDLLAQLNDKPATLCVAKQLTSRYVTNKIQNYEFYFSPYADDSQVTDPEFKKMYINFIKALPTLSWIEVLPENNISSLNKTWSLIKLQMKEKNANNE